jgi:integrase/recombinase XerD
MDITHRQRKNVSDVFLVGNPADPQGLTQMLIQYLEWMRIRNYSDFTVTTQASYLSTFIDWASKRSLARPSDITKPILERYQRHLFYYRKADGKAIAASTQHKAGVCLRSWFKWLARNNHILYNPASDLELPKLEKRLPKSVLTQSEAESVMLQPDLNDPIGIRDRAILEVFYSTGIRRSELTDLGVYDIDPDAGTLIVRQGKYKKDRIIPIGDRAIEWTEKYIYDIRPDYVTGRDEGILFLSRYGNTMNKEHLSSTVANYFKQAKIHKGGSCHVFRHTLATLMLDNGADIRYIQVMLGHASVKTTEIYTQVSIKRLKAVHNLTHPAQASYIARTQAPDDDAPTKEDLLAELARESDENI